MKRSLFLLISSCLFLLVFYAGCGSPPNVTPSPSNITPYPANIYINIEPCQNDPENKIVIDNVSIVAGTLDRDYYTPAAGQHVAGEPCFLIAGNIKNGYNEDCWVAFHIEGFDASDNPISSTLETGPLPGWGQVYIASYSSMPLALHLSWSDNVTHILISSQRTTRLVPSPSPTNISITVKPTVSDNESKIVIYDVTVVPATLDREYIGNFEPGDPCWLVNAHIRNDYDVKYYVAYHAEGFDASGNAVSYTLDAGPIYGWAQTFIYGRSFENITLHLTWADNLASITLDSQMWYKMFP